MSWSLIGNGDGTITVVDEKKGIECTHNSLNESIDCNICGEWSEVRRDNHSAISTALIFGIFAAAIVGAIAFVATFF